MRGTRALKKRQKAYELFSMGKTIQEVEKLANISQRSSYMYFQDWRKLKTEKEREKYNKNRWSGCAVFCKCSCTFWRN